MHQMGSSSQNASSRGDGEADQSQRADQPVFDMRLEHFFKLQKEVRDAWGCCEPLAKQPLIAPQRAPQLWAAFKFCVLQGWVPCGYVG